MKYIGIMFVVIGLLTSQSAISEGQQLTPEQEQYLVAAKKIWNSLDRQQGNITIPNGVATLNVPESFYYLSPKDSETILVEVWGNPPGAGQDSLGMLFPSYSTPFDADSWGVTIEYEEDGYVSDENADEIDYDELLSQMKAGTRESSKQRVEQGYEPIELVGWASKPFYDKESHKLHWAKEVKFGTQTTNTLNYNIRVLGRKGVLILNFIAGMNQKEIIDSNIDTVLALAEFNQGSRYEDFNPSIDKVAAYGIGALVAGSVIAKTGLLAAALIFIKKFGVLIVIGVGALIGKLFKRKKA
ncbi:MAG: DUF2167 domain-containing protein [Candidatus Parabeggiatoa sp. nov. 3]|nr:MAG: DUF2167 domain-containing protein [Gammaproteobacteria bacterium]RKZ57190.1 MAG: DUF2167 domain-containing protein [Gammaproteobacteria bacterium]RKZ78621.1 MAG: DUF2167 domain-containing protein [Gammaproteobacteria bacterium]